MVEGKLVPSEMTVKLLLKAMDDNTNDKFLVDGFPRNHDNRETFERMVSHFSDNFWHVRILQQNPCEGEVLQHCLIFFSVTVRKSRVLHESIEKCSFPYDIKVDGS